MSKKERKATNKPGNRNSRWIWIIALAAIIGLLLLFFSQSKVVSNPNLGTEVSVETANKMRNEGAFILDVREQSEWEQGHIHGAVLIPFSKLPDRLDQVPKDKYVVVVCRTGRRSAEGRDILLKNGYRTVSSMTGGMNEWQAGGYPIETGK
jgi:rhodanese-related sulfurtransferase